MEYKWIENHTRLMGMWRNVIIEYTPAMRAAVEEGKSIYKGQDGRAYAAYWCSNEAEVI